MEPQFVYITTGSMEEARAIGHELVTARLAACVNLISPMRSIYVWEGAIQEDEEIVLIAKTRAGLLSSLVEKVSSMHSYECPCIVSLPMCGGNPDFLDWITDTVA